MGKNQRHLISEAKFLLKQKENELVRLEKEIYCLKQLILNDGYVTDARKKGFSDKHIKKWQDSKKWKKSKLKAAMGIREIV